MAQGGRRLRGGPPPVEGSRESLRRGYVLTALPAEGYDGPVPDWPLPVREDDEVAAREGDLWRWVWRTPQACAWSLPSERWRTQIVARWVRQAVLCESVGAKPADHGQLHRYADQIGLTTAGLREMGWKVATDEVTAKAAEPRPVRRERRLREAPGA